MSRLAFKYLSIVLTIYILSYAIKTVYVGEVSALLIMGLILLAVNIFIKPILLILTLPLNVLTLGLFSFIVNAWTIMIADRFVSKVSMGGFLNSLLAAFIITVLHHILRDVGKSTN